MGPQVPPNQGQPTPAAAKKLADFNQELAALCDKYLYDMRAVKQPQFNEYGALIGDIALMKVYERSPKDIAPAQPPVAATPAPQTTAAPVPTNPTPPPVPTNPAPAADPTPAQSPVVPPLPATDDTKKNDPSPAIDPAAQPQPSATPAVPTNPLDSIPPSPGESPSGS